MNSIEIFNFKGQEIRAFIINGEIWAVGKDITGLFGYERARDAISQHCKNACSVRDLLKGGKAPLFDLHPQTLLINEADINRLVFSSKLPQAEAIRDWWFEEVLPTIRKTGSYSIDPKLTQHAPPQLSKAQKFFDDSEVYKKALELTNLFFKDSQAKIAANNITKEITGTDILELVGATHLIPKPIDKGELLTPTELGKRLNLSARRTNSLLELAGFQSSYRDDKGRLYWALTEVGRNYGTYLDTGSNPANSNPANSNPANSNPVRQIKWYSETVNQLKMVW